MISAVILTKNEENSIIDCLESVSFCDEILLVDDNSSDRTREIAKQKNARVIKHALDSDFAKQRNFAINEVKGDWVLFLDADEIVSTDLKKEILDAVSSENYDGFMIQRVDKLWGKELKHGDAGGKMLLRLAKKGSGKWVGKVHERWVISEKIGRLKNPLFHYPHQSISSFLQEINFYSSVRAEELYKMKAKSSVVQIIFYPILKFSYLFFLKLGILDGEVGLVHALMMSFYSFQVRSKLYLLYKK